MAVAFFSGGGNKDRYSYIYVLGKKNSLRWSMNCSEGFGGSGEQSKLDSCVLGTGKSSLI